LPPTVRFFARIEPMFPRPIIVIFIGEWFLV
jgi:hypothetical protein